MSPRGIDHLVLPVRDLDAAAARYAAMGFQVGAKNRHPWGTENRLVQFPGTFLELIALGEDGEIAKPQPGKFSFAAFVRDHLAKYGDGFAMLVLESHDAVADKTGFDAAGIGGFDTFFFEREGKRPDGSSARVAFTLAYAASPAISDAGFFVCQQHAPQNFWNPAFQVHRNGATGVNGVVLLSDAPAPHAAFLSSFSGCREIEVNAAGILAHTPRGDIGIVTPAAFAAAYGDAVPPAPASGGRLAAFRVAADLKSAEGALGEAGIPFTLDEDAIVVAAKDACGTAIIFERPAAPAGV